MLITEINKVTLQFQVGLFLKN